MKNSLIAVIIFFLSACNSNENAVATPSVPNATENLEGYEIIDIPGSDIKMVRKMGTDESIIEEGQTLNGLKTGTWVTFHTAKANYPKKIMTYTDGVANGPYFEFNNRGQMELKAFYINNKLEGHWGKYSFGRPTHEAYYKNGALDGVYREYKVSSGKAQKEIAYKDGQMHGKYIYYDDDGNISIEYTYENGEKIDH